MDVIQAVQSADLMGLATNASILVVFLVATGAGLVRGIKKSKADEAEGKIGSPESLAAATLIDNIAVADLTKALIEAAKEVSKATEAVYSHRNATSDRMQELAHQMERLRDKL